MQQSILHPNGGRLSYVLIFAFLLSLAGTGCQKDVGSAIAEETPEPASIAKPAQLLKDFVQVNLVGSNDEYDPVRIDPTLINPWGLTSSPTGTFWPASQGTGLSQLYNGEGGQVRAPVAIPSPFAPTGGNPTGIVFNSSNDFVLTSGPATGQAARFIFAGLDGVISGWAGAAGNFAVRMYQNVGQSVYTGLAIGSTGGANYLYASDFLGAEIDVFDKNFTPVSGFSFTDPTLLEGYAPFNIQAIGNWLYVLYALVGPDGRDVPAPGNGYVSIFNMDGTFVKRFASGGQLNAPWGIAQAPAGFYADDNTGRHAVGSTILIGNFGDGTINAYTMDGEWLGQLRAHGAPIVIDGLWGIMFPPAGATSIDPNRLYFVAGPDHEEQGLFGYITK
jgi:uncharacterized protein (TIGR03118 family)